MTNMACLNDSCRYFSTGRDSHQRTGGFGVSRRHACRRRSTRIYCQCRRKSNSHPPCPRPAPAKSCAACSKPRNWASTPATSPHWRINPFILSLSKDGGGRHLAMSFYVYILRCADGSYYTGHTENLEVRLAAHQNGDIKGYTSTRRPVELVFTDQFPSRREAVERERQVKGWSRAKKEALIEKDWDELVALARSRGNS